MGQCGNDPHIPEKIRLLMILLSSRILGDDKGGPQWRLLMQSYETNEYFWNPILQKDITWWNCTVSLLLPYGFKVLILTCLSTCSLIVLVFSMSCHDALDLLQNMTLPSQHTSPISHSPTILLFAVRCLIHIVNLLKTVNGSFIHQQIFREHFAYGRHYALGYSDDKNKQEQQHKI